MSLLKNKVLAAMLFLGMFAVFAQVLFMREMLVAFLGNELTIGIILGSWLTGIGAGAFMARFFVRSLRDVSRGRFLLAVLLLVASVLFPVQVYLVRVARLLMNVAPGEYAAFEAVLTSALLIFSPTCLIVGFFFPFACSVMNLERQGVAQDAVGDVSLVYTFEAIGSMLGGVLLTYVFIPLLSPLRMVLLGSCLAVTGAGIILPRRVVGRVITVLAAGLAAMVLVVPGWLDTVEEKATNARWHAFGIMNHDQQDTPTVRLVASKDTIYQNLAVTESEGQFALYGNGQIMWVFPDPIEYEHSIHFLMAQNPGAKDILLLGGNPLGDMPELLKYRLRHLVYVEIDPGIGMMMRAIDMAAYDRLVSDHRVKVVTEDGPRYVRECGDKFDIVIINAPQPATSSANRFYTVEFYENVKRILKEKGFLFTAIDSSERLQSDTVRLGASVYESLYHVFPLVLVTAGSKNKFFAGNLESRLNFNRRLLAMRHESAQIPTEYFMPEYFIGADEISTEKTCYVHERFLLLDVPLNTVMRPVTYFYNLLLWCRFSGSRVATILNAVASTGYWQLGRMIACSGIIFLLVGTILRILRIGSVSACWSKSMAGLLIATTGFCGIALEILLIFAFQSLYGYIYTKIGLIVAAFMLGLVLGAPSGRMMASVRRRWIAWGAMAGLELALLAVILTLPSLLGIIERHDVGIFRETLIYIVVGIVGWIVGGEFPLINRLFRDADGGDGGTAAAITDSADHMGSAIGAFVMGVILIPVFGIGASCFLMAVLKCVGLLCLASAILTLPRVSATLPE